MPSRKEVPSITAYRRWCREAGIDYSISDSMDDLHELLNASAPYKLQDELQTAVPNLMRPRSAPVRSPHASLLATQYDPRGTHVSATSVPERQHIDEPDPGNVVVEEQASLEYRSASVLPSPPSQQLVLSRVIASSEELALEVSRLARGTGSLNGVEGARITALRMHLSALRTLKQECLDTNRRAQREMREANERVAAAQHEAARIRQDNMRMRWALSSQEIGDIKEDAALAFMSAGGLQANKSSMSEKLAQAREKAAFQHQLDEALKEVKQLTATLIRTQGELIQVRTERDALLSFKRKSEIEIERLHAQLRSLGVDSQYQMARLQQEDREHDLAQAAEAAAYAALMSGQLEAAKHAFEKLLAETRELKLSLQAKLANRVPAGRIVLLRGIAVHHIPDFDKRGQTSDPYVKFTLLNQHGAWVDDTITTTKKNNVEPSWTEVHRLIVPHGISLPLTVIATLWDKDWHQADQLMAEARFSIGLGSSRLHQKWTLKHKELLDYVHHAEYKNTDMQKMTKDMTLDVICETSDDMFFDPAD